MRGLGTGMLVTAAIFIWIGGAGDNASLSDAQIIERAKELGMVEINTLADLSSLESMESTETIDASSPGGSETNETKSDETKSNESKTEESESGETMDVTSEESNETAGTPNETNGAMNETTSTNESNEFGETDETTETRVTAGSETNTIQITIRRGDSSLSVSRLLEDADLVENAREYDQFLCDEGYDHSLRVGEHFIPTDAGWDEIAQIITGSN
ncbi:MAG: endolytic transglycosylase MltG [Clostridium sp.]|nr:endolytic transglycosylase MltG [Clostridium sp.]